MSTQLIYLLGDPVAHSRSPAMQNAALQALGIDARYQAWHTPAAELAAHVQALREPHVLGANVTLPHKEAVVPLLDRLTPIAEAIGAVNTIFKDSSGALCGTNTDAPGMLASLHEQAQYAPSGQSAIILGASGAARAAGYALLTQGLRQLTVLNRTLARAEELLADLLTVLDPASEPVLLAIDPGSELLPELLADASLLVNATSLGWHGDETPLPDLHVSPGCVVLDMVYRETRLLRDAAACGALPVNGLGMLVHQGALALQHWVGRSAPLALMWAAVSGVERSAE